MSSKVFEKIIEVTSQSLNREAISYLKTRGISKDTAIKWKIGFLKSEQLLIDNFSEDEINFLYEKGILLRRINKSPLSQYITFPMIDQYNNIVGLSGRPPLPNDQVKKLGLKKYWHSRFDKRKFLFGLNNAIESVREKDEIIIVEGQFDTITTSQAGLANVVSTCGTALTDEQIILLSRYASKLFIVFDNDTAGQNAFEQLKKYNKTKTDLIPVILPDSTDQNGSIKEDPDSYIKKFGISAFEQIIQAAKKNYYDSTIKIKKIL